MANVLGVPLLVIQRLDKNVAQCLRNPTHPLADPNKLLKAFLDRSLCDSGVIAYTRFGHAIRYELCHPASVPGHFYQECRVCVTAIDADTLQWLRERRSCLQPCLQRIAFHRWPG